MLRTKLEDKVLGYYEVVDLCLDSSRWLSDEWVSSWNGEAMTMKSSLVRDGNGVGAAVARVVAATDMEGLTGCFIISGTRGSLGGWSY